MKKVLLVAASLAMVNSTQASTTEDIGDITQLLTPLIGLGLTYYYDDTEGRWQFVKSFATSQASVHVIKNLVEKNRPNYNQFGIGSGESNSFPSGHTSAAFGGASFIYSRYGAAWGIPAYAMAAFTGYSRVYAEKHYWDDVIAGASIATLSSLYFVNPVDSNFAVIPKVDGDSVGASVVISSAVFDKHSATKKNYTKPFQGKYKFEFFPAMSKFRSKDINEPSFDVDYKGAEDEIQTSAVRWSMQADNKNELSFFWNPYEIRAVGDFSVGEYHSRYLSNDFRFAWHYGVNIAEKVIAKAGVALVAQYTETEIFKSPQERSTIAKDSEWFFYPLATVALGYQFTPKLAVIANGSYGKNGNGTLKDWTASIDYKLNERWDIGAGYSWYERDQQNSNSFKNTEFDSYFIKLSYHF